MRGGRATLLPCVVTERRYHNAGPSGHPIVMSVINVPYSCAWVMLPNQFTALTSVSLLEIQHVPRASSVYLPQLTNESFPVGTFRRVIVPTASPFRHLRQRSFCARCVPASFPPSFKPVIRAKREEAARSTVHGRDFEDLVWEFVQREAQKMSDVPNHTGSKVWAMRNCKMGDAVITLGEDTAASGEKIVIEAKEDCSYDLDKACVEIQTARKNRDAAIGLFVFSRTTAPVGQETLLRHGNDIFLIWEGEDLQSDVNFKAALMVAKALSVRQAKARTEETADFERLDKAIVTSCEFLLASSCRDTNIRRSP
jgi:hypothetical protein